MSINYSCFSKVWVHMLLEKGLVTVTLFAWIRSFCSHCFSSILQPEHQQLIVDAGALPHLVDLLKRQGDNHNSRAVNGVIRRAADAITNLAHENSSIKTRVRLVFSVLMPSVGLEILHLYFNTQLTIQDWGWYPTACRTAWVPWCKGAESSCWSSENPCL